MKFVVQRVKNAQVDIEGKTVGKIEQGYMVLIGITHTDTKEVADYLVKKLINLRVFEDENGKMNKSLKDVNGSLLLVSQFIFQSAMYATTKSRTVAVRRASRLPEKYLIIMNLGISRFQRQVRSCSATVTVTISKK